MVAHSQGHGRSLTKAQQRELLLLSGSEQLTHGSARARVQNALVAAGLAKFLDIDGIGVCRITDLGHEASRTGRVPPKPHPTMEPSADDLRRYLRSLRNQRVAVESDLVALGRRIEETEAELAKLERGVLPVECCAPNCTTRSDVPAAEAPGWVCRAHRRAKASKEPA